MGPGILPETTVGEHNPPCHLQMPTKALSCKKEAILYVNMFQKRRCVLWAKAHLKWTVSKWKSVLWSDESKFPILIGNHRRCVLRAKEEGDLPACYQCSVQQPASLMVWRCVLEGTMNAERYRKVLQQHVLPSRWRLFQGRPCVFQQDKTKPHTAAITTAWLRSRRGQVLNCPACSPDLSPIIENIWRIFKRKIRQRRPRTRQQHNYDRWDNVCTELTYFCSYNFFYIS